ncbi:MAG: hypothetical protein ACXW29_13165, partial [Thermoanaerobaculia bacterium]
MMGADHVRFAFLFLLAAASAGASATSPLRIGTITIRSLDIYSNDEAERGRVYRAANALHPETRQSVIRRFLLVREGEEYRPERLAESERNLRALHFLKSASVVASEPHAGVIDVMLTTQDAWSIAPETQAGNKGGESTYGASITDTNVLGRGKEMSISWDKTVDRTRLGFDLQDPAFNSALWNAHVAYGRNSDGYDHRLQFRRPFFSFATPWAAELSFQGFRQNDKLYGNGFIASEFEQKHKQVIAAYGRALRSSDLVANRVTAGLRLTSDSFAANEARPVATLPAERDYRYAFLRFEHADNDFLKLNFVNKDIRYEDFNLGAQYAAEVAVSPRAFGADATSTFVKLSASKGLRLGERAFLLPSIAMESRFDGGPQNAIATASVVFVRRDDARYPRATVARIAVNSGWRVDPEVQFFADGVTGLRAYRVHTLAGSRSLVMNFEQRLYLGREILQLISPGVVAFVDAGNATDEGGRQLLRLYSDAGIGLRIGLPRTPKNLLRIDFGYAMRADARGRKGLMVSVSSGQAF